MKKRIALAAAAALAGGLLVAAPASATPTVTPEVDHLTSGTVTWSGAGVAGPSNFVLLNAVETSTTTSPSGTFGARVEISGSTILAVTDVTGDSITASQVSSTVAVVGNADSIKIAAAAAGTITATIYWATGLGTFSSTAQTATFVVGTPSAAVVYNHTVVDDVDLSSASAGINPYVSGNTLYAYKGTAGSNWDNYVGWWNYRQYTSSDTSTLATDGVTTKDVVVTLTGVGVLEGYSSGTGWTIGNYMVLKNDADGAYFQIYSDGRAGTATINVSVDGVVLKTYNVVFYGDVATYTASIDKANIQLSGSATLTIVSKDANGNAVPNQPYSISVDSATVGSLNSGTVVGTDTYTVTAAAKNAATIKVYNGKIDTKTVVANFVTSGVKTVTLTADKASYAPGEKATFTVNAKNADGVTAGDGTYDLTVGGSTALFGAPATVTVKNGVGTFTAYLPVVQGPVVVTAAVDASAAASVTVSVVDAAAVAQAAAITALQTSVATLTTTVASLVASMTAQIKVINATMLKIQKALAALRLQVNKIK